jgi:hypothetical protein
MSFFLPSGKQLKKPFRRIDKIWKNIATSWKYNLNVYTELFFFFVVNANIVYFEKIGFWLVE